MQCLCNDHARQGPLGSLGGGCWWRAGQVTLRALVAWVLAAMLFPGRALLRRADDRRRPPHALLHSCGLPGRSWLSPARPPTQSWRGCGLCWRPRAARARLWRPLWLPGRRRKRWGLVGRADWVGREGPRSREMMAWMLWCGCGMQHSRYPRHRVSEHSKPSPPVGKLVPGWPQWSNLPDPCTVMQHPLPSSPLTARWPSCGSRCACSRPWATERARVQRAWTA